MKSGGRLYWVCQIAGWGSFLAYVLGAYLLSVQPPRPWDIVSIVFFNGVVCPALTHGLRHWMKAHGWLDLPLGRLWLRFAAVIVGAAAGLAAAVALGIVLCGDSAPPLAGMIGVFAGFTWAFTGWLTIYYVVHARRRRDALQLVVRDAQLRALRAQLNPHFLFNSLNSLRHLILSNPDRAVSMVTGLADLLRYSLQADRRDLVPLADELQIVEEYLALECIRFEERLQIERDVDPAALVVNIPPMLIQTLVDNAIKHGIAELPRGGRVRIEARVIGRRLELVVANTGRLQPPAADAGHGLHNARERLRLLYDGAASLTLSDVDGMTVAGVSIPIGPDTRNPQP